jgi:hypothetical protein
LIRPVTVVPATRVFLTVAFIDMSDPLDSDSESYSIYDDDLSLSQTDSDNDYSKPPTKTRGGSVKGAAKGRQQPKSQKAAEKEQRAEEKRSASTLKKITQIAK